MKQTGARRIAPFTTLAAAAILAGMVAACAPARLGGEADGPWAPGVDLRQEAVDGVQVGNRLIEAGEYELALDAFTRAALAEGMTPEILSGLGTANLGLGRLGQAETLLRRAVEADRTWPEAWNNLGVVLMERGKTAEAQQVFRTAYALDNGQSDLIRDNLRIALAKSEIPDNNGTENKEEYKLVQQSGSTFAIRKTP